MKHGSRYYERLAAVAVTRGGRDGFNEAADHLATALENTSDRDTKARIHKRMCHYLDVAKLQPE